MEREITFYKEGSFHQWNDPSFKEAVLKCTLMYKTKPVASFIREKNGDFTKIIEVMQPELLPMCFQKTLTLEKIQKWTDKRIIPSNRDSTESVIRRFGTGALKDRNLFSLTDQYWFKYRNEKWEDMNFFTNPYPADVGNMFFMPWLVNERDYDTHSPDITTNGLVKKRWIQENGVNYLLKSGNQAYHQEPTSEVMCSLVMQRICKVPFVSYSLCANGLMFCSKCRCFIDDHTEFIPASYIYHTLEKRKEESVYTHLLRVCDYFEIPDAKKSIDEMILIDALCWNKDRHLGNFGFIRDVDTGKFVGPAPLFDFGNAFWNNVNPDKEKQRAGMMFDIESKNAINHFRKKCDTVMMRDIKEQLCGFIESYPDLDTEQKRLTTERIKKSFNKFDHRQSLESEIMF